MEDLLAPRQPRPDLGRRERHVEEERDRPADAEAAQGGRDEHQLVVVHPGQRVRLGEGRGATGEAVVDGAVGGPLRLVADVVLAVGEPVVVALDLRAAQLDARQHHVEAIDSLRHRPAAAVPAEPRRGASP